MTRIWLRIIGANILIFWLLTAAVLVWGHILPTKQLAYIMGEEMGRSNLVLLDLYHRIHVNLIPRAFAPSWSPDGERIAFYSDWDSEGADLYILDVFSHRIQRLTHNGAYNVSPSWSPDGREIVFASTYDSSGIFIISINCTDSFMHCATRLTPKDAFWYDRPVWSPDGKSIAFTSTKDNLRGSYNIFIMNRDGSNLRRLTKNLGNDTDPAWSFDSRQIVYTAQNMDLNSAAIMIVDTNCYTDTNCSHLVFGNDAVQDPAWSPDGSSIAFINYSEIYLTDIQGHYLQRLTYDQVYEFVPRWRP